MTLISELPTSKTFNIQINKIHQLQWYFHTIQILA